MTMKKSPDTAANQILISVIIPVYCAEQTLRQCLDSVLTQSIQEIEVICVDDGSTDRSLDILREYERRDPRVSVLTQKNQYAGTARNRGLEHAHGEYAAFLDSDDYYLPHALQELYRLCEANNLDFVKAGFRYLDVTSGRESETVYSRNGSISALQRRRVLRFDQLPHRLLNVSDVPWNGLYRRSFLEQNHIRFNHLRCINDHSFYIHCLMCAERMMVSQKEVVCYRVQQEGSLINIKANHFEYQLESYHIVRKLTEHLPTRLRQIIMGQELNAIFSWYHRLLPAAQQPELLKQQFSQFLKLLDENDCGKQFLSEFPFASEYAAARGLSTAVSRPNLVIRTYRCWQEHGLAYCIDRVKSQVRHRTR